MSEPPQEAQPVHLTEPTKDVYVPADLACKQCGYNLFTLSLAGVCPECGTPVEHSLRGFLLKYASPEWVGRVARGGWLIVIAGALMTILGLGLGAWEMYTFPSATTPGTAAAPYTPANSLVGSLAFTIVFVPLTALMIAGLLLFTARNPADALRGPDNAARLWLRRSLWLYAASILLGWIVLLVAQSAWIPASALELGVARALSRLLPPVGTAVYALIAALGLRCLGQLMARIPRPGLVRFSGICFWGVLICGILTTLGQIAGGTTMAPRIAAVSSASSAPSSATMPSAATGPVFPTTGLGMVLAGCPSCVGAGFYVASFVLLIMASAALSGAAREARQNAALPAPGAPPLGSPS